MTFLQYKCRCCGNRFSASSQLEFGHGLPFYIERNQLVIIHDCGPSQLGLADLIGEREPANG